MLGTVSIYGVNFNVSANALVVGGSSATFLNVENCYFTIDIATAISFTNSNTSSQINLRNCSGNTGSSSVAVWACSGAGALNLYDCDFTNFGSSTATNTSIAGTVSYYRGSIGTQMQFAATCQALLLGVVADTSAVNVPAIIAGSAGTTCFNCLINSGTADAVQVSATAVMSQCFIGATGANAITGAGTLFYSDLTFGGTNTITVSTATPQNWQPYSTAGNSSTAVRGTAGFDSTYFTDVNGFVITYFCP